MSKKIIVSDDVFMALKSSKKTAEEILMEILTMPQKDFITRDGTVFPEGTAFLTWYKNRAYYGNVKNGAIEVMGERFNTVSEAARKITGSSINGWAFWYCKRPSDREFIKISTLRKSKVASKVS